MLETLRKRWFLISLFILIPGGMLLGIVIEPDALNLFSRTYAGHASRLLVAVVLFLMSITLDSRKLVASARSPGPVIWATLVNYAVIPLAALAGMRWQLTEDFAVGLMIAASVPCTMATASVWTRKAGGNDAVSLLVTVLTNGLCFLVTPFWLWMAFGNAISLDTIDMIKQLFITALIPIALGQWCRVSAKIRKRADDSKTLLGVLAQIFILSIIFWASIKGGPDLKSPEASGLDPTSIIVVWLSCIGLHVLGMAVVFYGSILLGFSRENTVGTAFAGSQKTLAIGVYIATDLLADRNLPFAVFPILMFHASQLFLDTLVVEPMLRWVTAEKPVVPSS